MVTIGNRHRRVDYLRLHELEEKTMPQEISPESDARLTPEEVKTVLDMIAKTESDESAADYILH